MRYKVKYLEQLFHELTVRYEALCVEIVGDCMDTPSESSINVDSIRIHSAVDDFKSLLTEIRRLK